MRAHRKARANAMADLLAEIVHAATRITLATPPVLIALEDLTAVTMAIAKQRTEVVGVT